tara:strand:+ start:104 stop:553 length:450 start_codon:yes stop_codon:yes gene_type:complete
VNLQIKNLKVMESLSEETLCFTASIHLDGKKVGDASNRGNGGATSLWYIDGIYHKSKIHEQIEEYAKTLEPLDGKYAYDAEFLIDQLVSKEYQRKQDKKLCSRKTVFRIPNHDYVEGEYHTMNIKFNPIVKKQLIEKYGKEIFILNENI